MLPSLSVVQYLLLAGVPRFSVQRLQAALSHCSIDQLLSADETQLQAWQFSPQQISALRQPNRARINLALAWLEQSDCHLIGCFDALYPECLRNIQRPPLLLFVRGNPALLAQPQLAMVGSRHAGLSGLNHAKDFAQQLAQQGLTITSGMALGIDAAAHKGALLARPDATIAVVATGLDRVYPKRHQQLAHEIVQQGAIVSEFWPGTAAKANHFPRRNRIISGLSQAVLVVQAGLPSGSLLTANYAAEQGRDVFAVPGSIDDPLHAGCHHLIQQGAKLVTSPVDIMEELGGFGGQSPLALPAVEQNIQEQDLPYRQLLDNVSYETTSIDELVLSTQQPVDAVLAQLTELEILGVVAVVPGGYVKLRRN
ncbi:MULTISPECIES: DNA-processing protein DprA [unclassified Agarivorans]|uniref:DNA-processing protein DprA n=1 Tax=unclassified Agarivorans TaxID=2636026 RepID=UPI0026E2BAF6|nr:MULTISPECIES: DNA-processing protein DprA [unclassified Agarivorans]MDO6685464.1 DNA-processing protein DprA [Agarivorans sp. 3_MG-2023]MDO6715850.1 DNA-processing protein DprA [Agarivorans sp. 2_MG-2023]